LPISITVDTSGLMHVSRANTASPRIGSSRPTGVRYGENGPVPEGRSRGTGHLGHEAGGGTLTDHFIEGLTRLDRR
jgi:hypothetical protein